jgi:hypothetical protein
MAAAVEFEASAAFGSECNEQSRAEVSETNWVTRWFLCHNLHSHYFQQKTFK